MVYSATSASAALGNGDPMSYLKRQAVYALIGVVAHDVGVALRLPPPPRCSRRRSSLVALGLCAAVLVLGPAINGAHRWFVLRPGELPAVRAREALALPLRGRLPRASARPADLGELAKPLGILTAIFCALDRDRARPRNHDHHRRDDARDPARRRCSDPAPRRRDVLALAARDARDLVRAVPPRTRLQLPRPLVGRPGRRASRSSRRPIGIGSGGVTGAGLGEGVGKISYLPEAHTDMIFAVIGEELGLIGATLVIGAFALLAFAGFRIALRCQDPFGKLLAAGITALVCGQAAINLAAALGIAPLTGIPLPFVSYGGSSLVVLLAAMGILLNIAVNERVVGASVRDRSGRDRRARATGTRGRRSTSRARGDGDVRRVARPRRVAARS